MVNQLTVLIRSSKSLLISARYTHLPPLVQFDYTQSPDNELSFYLKGRFQYWRESIARPLLYYALHQPSNASHMNAVLPVAQKCIDICAEIIPFHAQHNRHGGTWFVMRRLFICSLLILGSVICGKDGQVLPPQNWDALVRLSLRVLRHWGCEAADVKWMEEVLGRMFERTIILVREKSMLK